MSLQTSVTKDTSTTLNIGTSGDVMDESSIVQNTSGAATKRARIAVGFDDGSLQTSSAKDDRIQADVSDKQTQDILNAILITMQAMLGITRLMCAELGIDVPNDACAEIGEQD